MFLRPGLFLSLSKASLLKSYRCWPCRLPRIQAIKALPNRNRLICATITLGTTGAAAVISFNSCQNSHSDVGFLQPTEKPLALPFPEISVTKNGEETVCNLLSAKTLYSLLVADLPYLLLAVFGAFGAAYFNIRIPLILGDLINVLAKFTQPCAISIATLKAPSLQLCSAFSLQSLCTFAYIGFLATVGERLAARLKRMLFYHVLFQKVKFFDSVSSGWIIERMTADVQDFKSSFKLCVSQGLRSGAQIIGSSIAMYMVSPTLTATLLGCLPLICFVGSLITSQLRRLSHIARDKSNETTDIATETFTHIRRYTCQVDEARKMHELLGYGIGCFQGLSNFAMNGLVLGVLYLGGNLIARGDLDAGQLMSFLVATQAVHRSLMQISLLFGHAIRGLSAAVRISEVLSSSPCGELQAFTTGLSSPSSLLQATSNGSAPSIHFENVTFCYPNRPEAMIFENLNFEIPAGKVVALVGESGAGKSTILSLLERFYEPVTGRITLNGVDIREFSLSALRGQVIGYISQESEIFHTTVRENIHCAQPTASHAEVLIAASSAQVDQFVGGQSPLAYETQIGGGSSSSSAGLSGGQRQRLIIARALLKNAPVLLLDEATSALDAESEFQVQLALQNAMSGRTVLIVAHRLSTVRRADLIIVMHRGQIVETGTHRELLSKKGRYYNLVQRQGGDEALC